MDAGLDTSSHSDEFRNAQAAARTRSLRRWAPEDVTLAWWLGQLKALMSWWDSVGLVWRALLCQVRRKIWFGRQTDGWKLQVDSMEVATKLPRGGYSALALGSSVF